MNNDTQPDESIFSTGEIRKQELLVALQSHISFKYHDALSENISIIQNLVTQKEENMDFSKKLSDSIISTVTSFLDTFTETFCYILPHSTTQERNFSFADVEEKPIKKFRETFRKQLRGVTFLANGVRNKTQLSAKSESLKCLDKMCSLGRVTDDDKAKLVASLQKRMDMEGYWIEMIDSYRKLKVTEAIKSELYDNFQETLRIEYPKLFYSCINESVSPPGTALVERNYYDENDLLSFVNNLRFTIVSDFKEQIAFQEDRVVILKLVERMEERLGQDIDKLIAENLANKNRHCEMEIETMLAQSIQSYESKMTPIFNPGTQVTIISIEKQHDSLKSAIVQEFQEKYNSLDETTHLVLQQRIFECIKRLVSTASVKVGNDLEYCRKTCKEEISSCLINLESHLGKVSSESPKYVGELRFKLEKWLEETFGEMKRGTVASKENVEGFLNRAAVSDSASFSVSVTEEEKTTKKLEYIKSKVTQAFNKFIEMTEASKRKSDSLETMASFIRGQVKSQLECEIKALFGDFEPTELHIKDLEGKMNQYVMTKMVRAMENLDKKIDHLPSTSASSSDSKTAKQNHDEIKPKVVVKTEETAEEYDDVSSCDSIYNDMEHLKEGEYILHLEERSSLSPVSLIFQFSVNGIQMGMMNLVSSTPYMLDNAFGCRVTPTIVGLTQNGNLVYGPQIDRNAGKNSGLQTFAIEHHLLHGTDFPWSTEVFINGKIQKITVELLLAFLLRKLKFSVEERLRCKFSQTVIAVPYWMTSAQRVQIKDAGRIAGFLEVHLVNDLPSVAFAFITNLQKNTVLYQNNIIMVLSENADYVDSAVYIVEQAYPEIRLKMMGYHGCSLIECRMKGNVEYAINSVMNICKEALAQLSSITLAAVLVVCAEGNNNIFWRQILENVRMEYFGNRHCTILNEKEAVLTGAILLAQTLEKYGANIKNKVGCDFWRTRAEINRMKTGLNVTAFALINVKSMLLPAFGEKPSTIETCLPKPTTAMTLCQSGVNMRKCLDIGRLSTIPVGCLNVFDTYPSPSSGLHRQFIPCFNIDHEGIVSLNNVLMLTNRRNNNKQSSNKPNGKKRKRFTQIVSPTGASENSNPIEYQRIMENDLRISWTTPNLTKIQVEQFKKLLTEMDKT